MEFYYCQEHAKPGSHLLTAGISRSLPPKPHVTVEGGLSKSIPFFSTMKDLQDSGESVQGLLALTIKAAAFLDPDTKKLTISTGDASKYFIFIRKRFAGRSAGQYDASIVRRERIVHTYRDTHIRPPLNALARIFEVVQHGPPKPSIIEALRGLSVDLDDKIALKRAGKLPIEPWKAIEPAQMMDHATVVRGTQDIARYDERKHGGSDLLQNATDPVTGQKAVTAGFGEASGAVTRLGVYEYATEGIIEKDGKVRALRGGEAQGNRDWVVVKLRFESEPYDVQIKVRSPHHCNKCDKCIGHVDPGF